MAGSPQNRALGGIATRYGIREPGDGRRPQASRLARLALELRATARLAPWLLPAAVWIWPAVALAYTCALQESCQPQVSGDVRGAAPTLPDINSCKNQANHLMRHVCGVRLSAVEWSAPKYGAPKCGEVARSVVGRSGVRISGVWWSGVRICEVRHLHHPTCGTVCDVALQWRREPSAKAFFTTHLN
jgi:hypothetical protein